MPFVDMLGIQICLDLMKIYSTKATFFQSKNILNTEQFEDSLINKRLYRICMLQPQEIKHIFGSQKEKNTNEAENCINSANSKNVRKQSNWISVHFCCLSASFLPIE